MNHELQPCGTRAAYARHLYHGERPDAACRAANRARTRAWNRASRALACLPELGDEYAALIDKQGEHPRRWERARRELVRRHPDQFQQLFDEELAVAENEWRTGPAT